MTLRWRSAEGMVLVLLLGLNSCSYLSYLKAFLAPSPTPFFVPNPRDARLYQTLAREAEGQFATCAESNSCDRAHFMRALVALYENREVAAGHFQETVAAAPKGRLASSSLFWISLLRDPASDIDRTGPLAQATERLVRDLLDREVIIQQLNKDLEASGVRALQRELKAREKKMEELTSQLEALKKIDREIREMTLPTKPPDKVGPSPEKETRP
jgi:hypothetical protein